MAAQTGTTLVALAHMGLAVKAVPSLHRLDCVKLVIETMECSWCARTHPWTDSHSRQLVPHTPPSILTAQPGIALVALVYICPAPRSLSMVCSQDCFKLVNKGMKCISCACAYAITPWKAVTHTSLIIKAAWTGLAVMALGHI